MFGFMKIIKVWGFYIIKKGLDVIVSIWFFNIFVIWEIKLKVFIVNERIYKKFYWKYFYIIFFFFDMLNFCIVMNKVYCVNKRLLCLFKDFNNKLFRWYENCGFGILKKNYIKKIR